MKLIDFLKVNLKYIFAIVIFFFIFFQIRSCINERKLYDSLSLLKGQIQEREASLVKKDKELIEAKKEHEEKIAKLNGEINSANSSIFKLEKKIVGKDKELTQIRETWPTLSAECQVKLNELDSKWTEKFNLAQDTIAEKDKIIFSVNEKYESEKKLRIDTEVSRDDWETQAQDSKQLNLGLERKIKKDKLVSTIKEIGLGIIVAILGIRIIF